MVGQRRNHSVQQADIDKLSPAGFVTRQQRETNAVEGIQAGDDIGQGGSQFRWRPVRIPCQVHHARLALRDDVVAGPVTIRSSLPETGNRTVDCPRIDLRHGLIAESQLIQNARPEVFDQYVGSLDQLPEDFSPSSVLRLSPRLFLFRFTDKK